MEHKDLSFKELVELISITDGELEEMLLFLDGLRATGVTNMWGAAPYLDAEFPDLAKNTKRGYGSSKNAGKVLVYWIRTFSERHPKE